LPTVVHTHFFVTQWIKESDKILNADAILHTDHILKETPGNPANQLLENRMSSVNEDIVQTSALSSSLILPPPEAQLSGSSSQESVPSQIAHHPLEERNRPGNWLDGYGDYVFERIVAQFQNTQLGCKLKYPCQSIGIVDDNGFKR